MKKIIIAFAAIAAVFCLASCNKAQIDAPQNGIKFNISVASPTATDTKAVKTGWVSGDKIFIWFDSSRATNPDLTITYNGMTWDAGELASGVSENLQASGTMKYFYLSSNTWDTSDILSLSSLKMFRFPNHNQSGDVAYYATPMILASHISGFVAPTYTFADDVLSLSLDSWKFLNNTQVTVPVPVGTDADDYRLSFRNTGHTFEVITDVRLSDSLIDRGTSSGVYAGGVAATDGAVFYLKSPSDFYTSSDKTTFTLVDMSSGSKKVYTFTTPSMKFPLSNGITIDKITGSGGCVENAFSAMKLPAFTGTADANWKIVE